MLSTGASQHRRAGRPTANSSAGNELADAVGDVVSAIGPTRQAHLLNSWPPSTAADESWR